MAAGAPSEAGTGGAPEVPTWRAKQVGKAASYLLRHAAAKEGLAMRDDAYVAMEELLACKGMTRHGATVAEMRWVVQHNDKQRYQIMWEGGVEYIRATQGHSITTIDTDKLLLRLTSPEQVPMCCHGTYTDAWSAISKTGLSRMARTHIHFVQSFQSDATSGAISGLRASAQILVFVDVATAMAAGIPFHRAHNGVLLSEGDPAAPEEHLHPAFFAGVCNAKDLTPLAGWQRPALPAWHAGKQAVEAAYAAATATPFQPPAAPTAGKGGGGKPRKARGKAPTVAEAAAGAAAGAPCPFRYLVILDFEATCSDTRGGEAALTPQEIIELPSVLVDTVSGEVVDEFQVYVRPEAHPQLTAFATDLTGITQAQVDAGQAFPDAWAAWRAWLAGHGASALAPGAVAAEGKEAAPALGTMPPGHAAAALVTCGDWDLKTMLPGQAAACAPAVELYSGEEAHLWARWVNIKKAFSKAYGGWPKGMMDMLGQLDMAHEGRHHSGIDDCRNIAAIARRFLADGKGRFLTYTTTAPAFKPAQAQGKRRKRGRGKRGGGGGGAGGGHK